MAQKKPKVGDRLLHGGNIFEITAVEERIIVAEQPEILEAKTKALEELKVFRAQQLEANEERKGATGMALAKAEEKWAQAEAGVKQLEGRAHAAGVRLRLRIDLLDYLEDQKMWGRRGQLLSAAQIEQFKKLTGRKPLPDAHPDALKVLNALGG